MKLNVCLVAAVILFHATQAALFRQTSYTYDRHDGELRFIAKFGIQEYTQVELRGTFNNRTATNESVTFAFVPYETWSELNRLLVPSNNCSSMANLTSMIAHHWSVPGNVSDTISDNTETEYWFLVFLGYVYVDARSPWQKASGTQFDYEITLTNVPSDVFTQQFSYDMKGVAIVTMVATFTYLVLLAFQVAFSTYSCVCLKTRLHLLVKLFASLLLLELVGHGFQLAHMGVYTQDGVGLAPLGHVGAGLVILGNCFLVLLFLLISRGWQLTKAVLHYKIVTFVLWALYVVFSAIFFAWMVVSSLPHHLPTLSLTPTLLPHNHTLHHHTLTLLSPLSHVPPTLSSTPHPTHHPPTLTHPTLALITPTLTHSSSHYHTHHTPTPHPILALITHPLSLLIPLSHSSPTHSPTPCLCVWLKRFLSTIVVN